MGNIFKFKQFEIDQAGCAMKINTDGVLLGAIAVHDQPVSILDIGTGTGVIALMLAQRYPNAHVDAVEIDSSAAVAAQKNYANFPFPLEGAVFETSFEAFLPPLKYDLIISNPPYFINDLKNPEKRKEIARHADEDFFELLLKKAARMLTKKGLIWMILPVKQAEKVVVNAVLQKLFPVKIIDVCSDQTKEPFRQIICLGFEHSRVINEQIYIYETQGVYTAQYKELLKDFFLAF